MGWKAETLFALENGFLKRRILYLTCLTTNHISEVNMSKITREYSWGDEDYEQNEGRFIRMSDKEWRMYCEDKLANMQHEKARRSKAFRRLVDWMDNIDYIRSDRYTEMLKNKKNEYEDNFDKWVWLLHHKNRPEDAEEAMEELETLLLKTIIGS